MGIMDKIKDLAKITDAGYFEDSDMQEEDEEYLQNEYEPEDDIYSGREEAHNKKHVNYQSAEHEKADRVVDIHSANHSHVVFKKLDKFDDVGAVADELNQKKIVILNLETCPNDVTRRVLDFLYGVAYANNGEIKRVAGRAYIITPYNVPVSGELLDEIEAGSAF